MKAMIKGKTFCVHMHICACLCVCVVAHAFVHVCMFVHMCLYVCMSLETRQMTDAWLEIYN